MILQIAISNWRSIRDKVVLNFRAVPGEVHAPGQVVEVPGVGSVLRAIGIYGANASGKSNVLGAIGFFSRLIAGGRRPGESIGVQPWAFRGAERESSYEVEFAIEGLIFAYGIVVDAVAVRDEWLVRLDDDEEEVIFRREFAVDRPRVTWGRPFWLRGRDAFYQFLAEGLRNEQPFAAEVRDRNGMELIPLLAKAWIAPLELRGPSPDLVFHLHSSRAWMATAKALIAGSDVHLRDLRVVSEPATEPVEQEFGTLDASPELRAAYDAWRRGDLRLRLEALHAASDGEERWLDESSLSQGTRRLIELAMNLISVQAPSANMLAAIDELDNSLHPLLAADLLRRFLQPDLPSPRSQLLFTTHDTTLLDTHLLGRDGVWLTERDASGATRLFPLTSYAREDLDKLDGRLEVAYLAGHFGAIPVLGRSSR